MLGAVLNSTLFHGIKRAIFEYDHNICTDPSVPTCTRNGLSGIRHRVCYGLLLVGFVYICAKMVCCQLGNPRYAVVHPQTILQFSLSRLSCGRN